MDHGMQGQVQEHQAPGQAVISSADQEAVIQHSMKVFEGVSDLHINCTDIKRSVVFPGPRKATASEVAALSDLIDACERVNKVDFMVWDQDICWRGRRDTLAVDALWYRLRRMPSTAPTLEELPTPMPEGIRAMLMMPALARGGLVYVVGSPGSGKTTTASGIVVSRLRAFGGYAYTVEDPPEMPINGWHGDGYCAQAWVPGERVGDWMEAMRGALRSQPSNTPSMLYVGEVRDQESARTMLRAASNGFLVVATGFGNDVPTGLDALIQLAGVDVLPTLAATLRIVIHQRLVSGILAVNVLASSDAQSQVALHLRNGQLAQLEGDVKQQANMMRLGMNPLTVSA